MIAAARRNLYPDARSTTRRRFRSLFRLRAGIVRSAVLTAVVAAGASAAEAPRVREVGAGVVAGYPIGGTLKLWLDQDFAVDGGVGFASDAVLWGDALYHMWNLLPQPAEGKLGVYLGGGPRLETGSDAKFGLRAVGGASWRLSRQPLELFAEAGPVFRLTQGGGVDADGGVGVRYYFGR